uniref:Uncharacterized protein n=1 Tax=Tilapia lake virus TaxID=1549864 RepID=A0A7G3S5R2_9VIRU|nr:hypothetical protein [Tilapia lake virus]
MSVADYLSSDSDSGAESSGCIVLRSRKIKKGKKAASKKRSWRNEGYGADESGEDNIEWGDEVDLEMDDCDSAIPEWARVDFNPENRGDREDDGQSDLSRFSEDFGGKSLDVQS